MTEDEKRINNIDSRVSSLETKFEMFMRSQDEKFSNFMQEMRDRDNQRAAEIMEIRQRQDAAQAKHDAEMREMNARFDAKFDAMDSKIDAIGNHVRNLSVATIIGVGTIAITVIYSILMR